MKLTEQGTIHTCAQLEHKKATNTPNRRMHLSKHLYHEREHRTTHTHVCKQHFQLKQAIQLMWWLTRQYGCWM